MAQTGIHAAPGVLARCAARYRQGAGQSAVAIRRTRHRSPASSKPHSTTCHLCECQTHPRQPEHFARRRSPVCVGEPSSSTKPLLVPARRRAADCGRSCAPSSDIGHAPPLPSSFDQSVCRPWRRLHGFPRTAPRGRRAVSRVVTNGHTQGDHVARPGRVHGQLGSASTRVRPSARAGRAPARRPPGRASSRPTPSGPTAGPSLPPGAELAAAHGTQQPDARPLRGCVLHRWRTRGSFHGTSCSSGCRAFACLRSLVTEDRVAPRSRARDGPARRPRS